MGRRLLTILTGRNLPKIPPCDRATSWTAERAIRAVAVQFYTLTMGESHHAAQRAVVPDTVAPFSPLSSAALRSQR